MLRGERVTLRAPERADLKRLHELQQNVDLVIFGEGSWQPTPLEVFERQFDKALDAEPRSWFAIEAGGKLIGGVGLNNLKRLHGTAELGIEIYDPEYVGQGYGRAAIALLLDWAFRIQNFRRIWLKTSAANLRAVRCYASLGFVEEGRMREQLFFDGRYVDSIYMGLLRREWQAARGEPI